MEENALVTIPNYNTEEAYKLSFYLLAERQGGCLSGDNTGKIEIEYRIPTLEECAAIFAAAGRMVAAASGDSDDSFPFAKDVVGGFGVFCAAINVLTNITYNEDLNQRWFLYTQSTLPSELRNSRIGFILEKISNAVETLAERKYEDSQSVFGNSLKTFMNSLNSKIEDVSFEELTQILSGISSPENAQQQD